MNRKNILFIESNTDGTIGGSTYCLLEIVKRINRNRFMPFILFFQENILSSEFRNLCQVIVIDRSKGFVIETHLPDLYTIINKHLLLRWIFLSCQRTYNFLRYNLPYFLRMIYLLFRFKIDIVHLNNSPLASLLIVSKILGKKCVVHLRGNWKARPLQRKLVKYYDNVISISDSVTGYVRRQNTSTENFVTIHDGIDVNAVFNSSKRESDEIKSELGLFLDNDNASIVGVVGNIKDWKGQHIALEAIKS